MGPFYVSSIKKWAKSSDFGPKKSMAKSAGFHAYGIEWRIFAVDFSSFLYVNFLGVWRHLPWRSKWRQSYRKDTFFFKVNV
jgi:hypothetical protein